MRCTRPWYRCYYEYMRSFRERTSGIFFGLAALGLTLGASIVLWSVRFGASASGHTSSLAVSNACLPGQTSVLKKENPNKMLFITCGGFLD